MFKKLTFAAAVLATAAFAAPSFAQTFSPSTGTVTGSGPVKLFQTMTVDCTASVTANLAGSTASVPSRSISGPGLCFLVVPYGTWSLATIPGVTNQVRMTIGANTVTNKPCYGTIDVAYNSATSRITFNNNVLPAVNAGDPSCTIIQGYITITPSVAIL